MALWLRTRGEVVARLSRFLGLKTNNYAEYSGLLAVLEWRWRMGRDECALSPIPS